jgi:frataxin-like iron-binding protein CyaY
MKKIIKFLGLALAFVLTFTIASCGKKEVVSDGVYYNVKYVNNKDAGCTNENYLLKLFSDNTYELTYDQSWSIHLVSLNYGRKVISYGTFTETANADGIRSVELQKPNRIQLATFHRGQAKFTVDTNNWPSKTDEDGNVVNGIEYTLMERAETETWETKEDFMNAYGRSYKADLDLEKGIMTITVDGTQIPVGAAVKLEA